MAFRPSKIDDLTRPDHSYLTSEDIVYFIGEYNAREGYGFSDMNQLIFNLKKPMDRRGRTDWRYKGEAIERAARLFTGLIKPAILPQLTIVPMPSSKRKDHPDHDDRMLQVVRLIGQGREEPVDVRELLVQEINPWGTPKTGQ